MKKKSSLQKILTGTRKSFSDFQVKISDLKQQREDRFNNGAVLPKSALKDIHKMVIEVSAVTIAKSTVVVLSLLLLV